MDLLAQSESLFALSNGHIGLRGNLDEGEPHGLPGTYLNSFYETRPLPYAEAGYGYPEDGQSIVDVTNGKILRLLVDAELVLNPRLPEGISCMRFRLRWRGFRLTVEATHAEVTYILRDGPEGKLTIRHAGEPLEITTDAPTTVTVRPCRPLLPPPQQPPGREPIRRRKQL